MNDFSKKSLILVSLWILIPFMMIPVIQGKQLSVFENKNIVEEHLPWIVAGCSEEKYHKNALKALAVINRTNYSFLLEQGKITPEQIKDMYGTINKETFLKDKDYFMEIYNACMETKGIVLAYEEELRYCPFFYSCGGITRDGFTYFRENSYPYLISVPSYRDEESENYKSYHYLKMEESLQILEKDKAGYVLWIRIGKTVMGGEIFCKKYHLPSACFEIEQKGEQVRIICKGKGHGFGFSLYGGNQMAKDGKSLDKILKHYYPEMKILK